MPKKEFVGLIEKNFMVWAWLDNKLDGLCGENNLNHYTKHQVIILTWLNLQGRAKLKDIAKHNFVSTASLCSTLRNMEKSGLVLREIDESDRRNTWYDVSEHGREIAHEAIEAYRCRVERVFKVLTQKEESELTESLKVINNLLNKVKKEIE